MDDDPNWRSRGACVNTCSEIWTSENKAERRAAQHICLYHCDVLTECRNDALGNNYVGVVAGGIIWTDSKSPANNLPLSSCPVCFDYLSWRKNAGVRSQVS